MTQRYTSFIAGSAMLLALLALIAWPAREVSAQTLSATRVAADSARFVPSPKHLDFGIVALNSSKTLTLSISNPGNIRLYVQVLALGGIIQGPYYTISLPVFTVDPGSSQNGEVTFGSSGFDGSKPGTFGGTLTYYHNSTTTDDHYETSSSVTWSAYVPSATATQNVAPGAAGSTTLGTTGIKIDFASTGSGGTVTVNTIAGSPPPGDALEGGTRFTPTGDTYVISASGLTGASFDLTLPNAGGSTARLAYRPEGSPPGTPWILIEPGKTVITGNVIIAKGIASFSEWTVLTPGTLAPTLESITPVSDIPGKRLNVYVSGTNFGTTSTFDFGAGITINSVEAASVTSAIVNVTIDSNAVLGVRDVKVTNPAPGGGTATLTGAFTVGVLNPTVTAVSPNSGDRGASVSVSLTGTNFSAATTTVSMSGGITVGAVTVASTSSLTASVTIPAGTPAGAYDVVVSNTGATPDTLKGAFTVKNLGPTVTAVSPASATLGETLSVTVTGTNFETGVTTALGFGSGISVTSFTVTNATTISASISVSSSATVGARNVTVTNASPGGGTATLANAFTIGTLAPTVSAISPNSGDRGSTVSITVTGSNFASGVTTLSLGGGLVVTGLTVASPTSLTASVTIPNATAAGVYDLTISNGTAGSATLSQAFTVRNLAPTVGSISPADAERGQTAAVTIVGTNFEAGVTTGVSIGAGITVSSFSVVSATQISASLSISATATVGVRDVTVTNASPGGGAATLTGGFTVKDVTSIEPIGGAVPEEFVLHDAFPNPFNPMTTIRFGLPERGTVTIRVYDVSGRIVADLVDTEMQAGMFQVQWNAATASSGTYLVRMSAEAAESGKTFSTSKKVSLVK